MILSFMSAHSRSHSTNTRLCSPAVVWKHDPHSLSAEPKGAQFPSHGIRGENESNPHSHPLPAAGRAAGSKLFTPPCWAISTLTPLERSSSFKGSAALCYCTTAYIHLAHRGIIIKQSKGWPEKVTLVLQAKKKRQNCWPKMASPFTISYYTLYA